MLTSKRPSENVLSHWYVLMDNFQHSTTEFYDEVEKELAARQAPGLKISRVDFYEGSALSDKRTYLRLARERYAFDVCAAPFGREYFFSLRFVEKPRPGWIALLVIMALMFTLYQVFLRIGGVILIIAAVVAFGAFIIKSIQTTSPTTGKDGSAGQKNSTESVDILDFDSFLLNFPILGEWYERLRKETYHRLDTRMVYHTLITEIVKKKVEEVTAAKGVKLVRSYEYSPILGDLYKTSTSQPNISTDSPPPSPI